VFYYEEDRIVVKSMAPLSPRTTKNENNDTKNLCFFESHVKRVYVFSLEKNIFVRHIYPWCRVLSFSLVTGDRLLQ
jgi:hypothetical protein